MSIPDLPAGIPCSRALRLVSIFRAGTCAVGVLWAGGAMAQDLNHSGSPFTNSGAYIGNVLSNTNTIYNDVAASWTGAVISNTGVIENSGIWLDGEVWQNDFKILNRANATWNGDIRAIGSDGSVLNWGNWFGDIRDNEGTVYNDGTWTGDILDNNANIVNGLDSNYSSLWVGDVLGNSSYILNYLNGRWEGDVLDNTGDIANYADWIGNLTNRGRIINYGVWTGNVVHTSTFFWAENRIVGNFDNRGWLQLIGDLDISGQLDNSGRLQLNHLAGSQTLTLGSAVFTPASSLEIDVTALGGNDRVIVDGEAKLGGTVSVTTSTDGGGDFDTQKSYTILSAGSLDGSFSAVTTDLDYLSSRLSYDANHVHLGLRRNDVGFEHTGTTANQAAVGIALEAMGTAASPIYDEVLWLTPDQADNAFNQLSGEIHASGKTALINNSSRLRTIIHNRISAGFAEQPTTGPVPLTSYGPADRLAELPAANRYGAWGHVHGTWGKTSATAETAAMRQEDHGFLVGADGTLGGSWHGGLFTGYSRSSFRVDDRASSGSSDNFHLGAYAAGELGAIHVNVGAAHSWHMIDTARSIAFPSFTDRLTAAHDARTLQAFGEASYRIEAGGARLEPFAGLAYVDLHSEGFTETGGAAALTTVASNTSTAFSTLGMRAATGFHLGDMKARARTMVGWRHAFGDTTPLSTLALAGGGSFNISGVSIARNVAMVELGLEMEIGQNSTIDLSYDGQFASSSTAHQANARLGVSF